MCSNNNSNIYLALGFILFSISLTSCNEIGVVNPVNVLEGQFIQLGCLFNTSVYDDNSFEILWLYPDDLDENGRVNYDQELKENNILSSILTIYNTSKSKDEGDYSCILNNSTDYLTEIRYKLIFRDDTSNTNVMDPVKMADDKINYELNIELVIGVGIICLVLITIIGFAVRIYKKRRLVKKTTNVETQSG